MYTLFVSRDPKNALFVELEIQAIAAFYFKVSFNIDLL
jgi:hypothetical protein